MYSLKTWGSRTRADYFLPLKAMTVAFEVNGKNIIARSNNQIISTDQQEEFMFFWVVELCNWTQHCSPKLYPTTTLHGAAIQKTMNSIFTTVKTLNVV
jgi:hypothetical protein